MSIPNGTKAEIEGLRRDIAELRKWQKSTNDRSIRNATAIAVLATKMIFVGVIAVVAVAALTRWIPSPFAF